jgi:zinc transport system substrate-binding protein
VTRTSVLRSRPLAATLLLAVGGTTLAACGSASADGDGGALQVVVGAYPLQFVAERVGGDVVDVTNLTPPGAEPHDLELAPRDVGQVVDADLVLLVPGLQPALDDAAAERDPAGVLDVTADVDLLAADDVEHEAHADEEGHEEGEGEESHEGHDHGDEDPHFWLDPTRLADAADAVAATMAEQAPDQADGFAERADALRADLEELDGRYADGLAQCGSRELVTAHTAFAYLADRYDLHQVGVTGISPEQEPSPGQLTSVTEFVRENGVTTIFTETLVSPEVAEVVADETGATTGVLDPIEGLSDDSAGSDYLEVMDANLESLRTGLDCA